MPEKTNEAERVNLRHLRGFRKIQQEILKALREGVSPKEYKSLAGAYKEAVAGERMVLGLAQAGQGSTEWPDEMVVRWVDDDEDQAGDKGDIS